jgi:hypothetical protein
MGLLNKSHDANFGQHGEARLHWKSYGRYNWHPKIIQTIPSLSILYFRYQSGSGKVFCVGYFTELS